MRKISICVLTALILGLTAAICAGAGVEMSVDRSINLTDSPLDSVMNQDGSCLYILTAKGEILVYSKRGTLKGSVKAPSGTEEIVTSPQSNLLYLIESRRKKIDIVHIDLLHDIDITGAPMKGPANAPVTIVEFSDFQCPFCAQLAPILEQVRAKYPDKVKLVFKNYPLRMHGFASEAAEAAQAAEMQGKFWPFYKRLFKNYNNLNEKKIQKIARSIGLNMVKFEKDRASSYAIERVDQDVEQGNELGITGVPAIFLNGRKLHYWSVEWLSAAILDALSKH